MKVVLLPHAQADLNEIHMPLLAGVRKRLAALGAYPFLEAPLFGPLSGYRATVVGHFRIVYKQTPRAVEISYIRDYRRS